MLDVMSIIAYGLQSAENLAKAVGATDITAVTPESLEIEAHNTLWSESDPYMLTALKLLPTARATQIMHQYARIDGYGNTKGYALFSERGIPQSSQASTSRQIAWVKLHMELSEVLILASLQQTVNVEGMTNAADYEPAFARLRLMEKQNRAIYFCDTSTTRFSEQLGLRYRGIMQQIREGTDGTTGTSPLGVDGHIIDMEGYQLTAERIRDRAAAIITQYGFPSSLIMAPDARQRLEGQIDNGARYSLETGQSMTPFLLGRSLAGLQTQGRIVWFHTDLELDASKSRPKYTATLEPGAPTTHPTVVAVAQVDNSTTDTVDSKWDAYSAGNIFYVVTEVVNGLESTGTRYPTGTGTIAVAAGEEVELTLTPGDTTAESFRVYRGRDDGGLASTDAWYIYEAAADSSGGAVTSFDNNLWRPNTSCAFGLNIQSDLMDQLHNPNGPSMEANYATAMANSAQYLSSQPRKKNAVGWAALGPKYMELPLAHIIATVRRPLLCSAGCPVVYAPRQNFVFTNVGTR